MDNTMTAEQREAYDEMRAERAARVTLEEGVRALQESLRPDDDDAGGDDDEDVAVAEKAARSTFNSPSRRSATSPGQHRSCDHDAIQPAGAVRRGGVRAGGVHGGVGRREDPLLDVTSGRAFDGHLGASAERTRLIVGRACKINVRAADHFGNARSIGGDVVEGVLTAPNGEVEDSLAVEVTDHGDGTYGLEFKCASQGVWVLQLKFNGRLSSQKHELVVSYGPLVASDLEVKPMAGPFLCGGYADVVVEVRHPELGRVMSGAEAFSVSVVSPSAMSQSVPLELEPGATKAIATVCWPEVGAHSVSVSLDGAPLPKCPMSINVLPEDICLAACQIQGSGTTARLRASAPRSSSSRTTRAGTVSPRVAPRSPSSCAPWATTGPVR